MTAKNCCVNGLAVQGQGHGLAYLMAVYKDPAYTTAPTVLSHSPRTLFRLPILAVNLTVVGREVYTAGFHFPAVRKLGVAAGVWR